MQLLHARPRQATRGSRISGRARARHDVPAGAVRAALNPQKLQFGQIGRRPCALGRRKRVDGQGGRNGHVENGHAQCRRRVRRADPGGRTGAVSVIEVITGVRTTGVHMLPDGGLSHRHRMPLRHSTGSEPMHAQQPTEHHHDQQHQEPPARAIPEHEASGHARIVRSLLHEIGVGTDVERRGRLPPDVPPGAAPDHPADTTPVLLAPTKHHRTGLQGAIALGTDQYGFAIARETCAVGRCHGDRRSAALPPASADASASPYMLTRRRSLAASSRSA